MTGVQTCALPIYVPEITPSSDELSYGDITADGNGNIFVTAQNSIEEIGRASCRERV